ncbi:MAG: A/G-specific adenine glycosylase, partial [Erysipelotrichaceae bacterium]|nr:A/G-specific adenine glycosylase [Erysipelotrichaceae bacterium]
MYVLEKEAADALLDWYRKNKRSFPWRDTGDPFDVWVSEIMLQQTRTEAVIGYFGRFKSQIKNIRDLSLIDEDELLRLWEGLGYYSRARSLKKCASTLMEQYDGKIPEDYETLLTLPGIGPYTAGAILSIGYGRPYAAVDGNVVRVLSRYFALKEDIRSDKVRKALEGCIKEFYEKQEICDPSYIRDLSQAFMDLGAMICIP